MLLAIGAGVGTEPAGVAGRVMRYLRRAQGDWLSRTELLDRLRNAPAHRLSDAIGELEHAGLIECRTVETATKPRDEVRLRTHPFEVFGEFGVSPGSGADSPNSPNTSNGHAPRIWLCGGCHLPRSRAPGACPGCGATGGHWLTPEALAS